MSRKPRRPNKFTGKLAKKIIATDAAEVIRQEKEKMILLAKHYGFEKLEPIPWGLVVLAMARDLITGFKRGKPHARRSGRPGTWRTGRGAELVTDVRAVMERDGLPLGFALINVSTTAKWKSIKTFKSLSNRYHDEIRRQERAVKQIEKALASFASLLGDLPGRTISARIRRAAATERPDPELETFLAELRRLLVL